jgi:hypothetical protein
MTDTTDPAPPAKPGYKTTEFWLKVAAMLLTALFASGVIPTNGPAATITAIAATMLGALGYTVSRSFVKATATLLVLVLAASTMTACAGTGATVKKEASYLEGCSAADAATIINAGKAIADDAKAIKDGGDKATAAIDVITQLALVQSAWQHCKSTAGAPAAGMP